MYGFHGYWVSLRGELPHMATRDVMTDDAKTMQTKNSNSTAPFVREEVKGVTKYKTKQDYKNKNKNVCLPLRYLHENTITIYLVEEQK